MKTELYEIVTADDLLKAQGAGSRGGKIIGKTKSGKPIYGPSSHLVNATKKWAKYDDNYDGASSKKYNETRGKYEQALQAHIKQHSGFNKQDHDDASDAHTKRSGDNHGNLRSAKEMTHYNLQEMHDRKGGATYKSEKYSQKKVRLNMDEMKKHPKKYPGGRKQAIAIGLNQAREEGKKSMIEKAKGGPGSRGGKISRQTKSGKPVYASHDHKMATQMSANAYQRTDQAYGKEGHAEAARAHLGAAFYAHHAGDKEGAKEHLNNAEHHHAEATKMHEQDEKGYEQTKAKGAQGTSHEAVYGYDRYVKGNKPKKSYSHKWNDKHMDATRDLIRGKNKSQQYVSKSLFQAMKEEGENQMDDIEAIFKSEAEDTEPMIEIDITDAGDGSETRLVPLSEISKSLRYMKKGKKRNAKSVASDNAGGRTKIGGNTSSKRTAHGVSKDPKMAPEITKGDEEASSEEDDVAVKGEAAGGEKKEDKKEEKKEEVKKPLFEIVKGGFGASLVYKDNTDTGDEAIAKAIEKGLGQGGLPSQRNVRMEKNS